MTRPTVTVDLTPAEAELLYEPLRDIRNGRANGNAGVFAAVGQIIADRLEFSRQTTANVLNALAESGAETTAAEAERDALAEKLSAVRAALLEGGQNAFIHWRNAVRILEDQP